ncbi:hypothetical protein TNCV_2438001 [Trichonephila clavipes]|nr:hypothetical protein TNCV_2438001 [Trichonephila clavipes]
MLVDDDLYTVQAWKKASWMMADRPESSTRAVAHHALNPADYLLRLSVIGTAMCAVVEVHSSCAEQL